MNHVPDLSRMELMDDETVRILRCLSPADRIAIISEINAAFRRSVANLVRKDHPGWTEEQVQADVRQRMLEVAMRNDG